MIYAYDISAEGTTIVNSEAYSIDEFAEAIVEALSDQEVCDVTIEVEIFEEGTRD